MEINLFLIFGLILIIAFAIKVATSKIGIPEVTGYVLVGVVCGILISKFSEGMVLDKLGFVSSVALGIIAFVIGIELKWEVIKKLGKPILFITLFEALGAFTAVLLAMLPVYHGSLPHAILLGSVAAATAPAATVAVIRQYKSKGVLTSTVLAVVGIDDAIALMIYVVASSIARASLAGGNVPVLQVIGMSALSIAVSFAIGIIFAFLYITILKKVKHNDWVMLILVGFILAMIGVCDQLKISELLSIMVFGMTIVNFSPALAIKSETIAQYFSPVFLAGFFIIGGAHLDIRLIAKVGLAGAVYFFARGIGKIGGGSLGAAIGRAPENVRKYIGFALLPQVGVALALALSINKDFNVPEFGSEGKALAGMVINILLLTTIFTEIIGPLLTRMVLRKAGETQETPEKADSV